jgi:lysine 6-dehydrogenase
VSYHYLVLGAGRQGLALAYDLARVGEADRVTLADVDENLALRGVERLETLLPDAAGRFVAVQCDASQPATVGRCAADVDVILSAVPYRFNVPLTDTAIAMGASFCDLGGNTAVVREQLARHEQAAAAGVSIVPDTGLAPGLGNGLAAHGIAVLDTPEHVHVRCGGLPQERVGPLQYKLVFNFQGLINEYSGVGEFLRAGERIEVAALTELEELVLPDPLGTCEAAVTSGGTSTCPDTYAGKLQSYDYKTIRYPGHFAIMRALFELGCFEEQVTLRSGATLEPIALLRQLMEDRLMFPEVRDLVMLRCIVSGTRNGTACTRTYDLLDFHDEETGFTAMERTTAFPAAAIAHLQARKEITPGARPLEQALPIEQYYDELPQHDIHIKLHVDA